MTSNLYSIRIADGFNVNMTRHIRDDMNNDLPLLDILGPKQAVRATWAKLISRKTYNYVLGGAVKLNKEPGHRVLKKELPNGWVNWTFVSKQAIPKILDPSTPAYCWKEPDEPKDLNTPPANFFPVLMASMPYPVLPPWENYLWKEGLNARCISRMPDCSTVKGYKIFPRFSYWKEIINTGFGTEHLNIGILPPEKPPEPEPDQFLDESAAQLIKVKSKLFPMGQIVWTPSINEMLASGFNIVPYIVRHAQGDWGDMDLADKKENDLSVSRHLRIMSAYETPAGKIWIITEADRSVTTVLLPEEY